MQLIKEVGLANLSKSSLRELNIQISGTRGIPTVDIFHTTINVYTKNRGRLCYPSKPHPGKPRSLHVCEVLIGVLGMVM